MADHMELDSIADGVMSDRSRMSRTFAERFAVRLARPIHVSIADRVEGHHIDRIDLNLDVAYGIPAADSHLRPLPQAEGDGDSARDDLISKLWTELHRSRPPALIRSCCDFGTHRALAAFAGVG